MGTTLKTAALLAVALQLFAPVRAQQQPLWQWAVQLGGPGWDMANGTAAGAGGNVYVAGGFTDSLYVAGKAVAGPGNRDVYAASFDAKGKLSWLWKGGGPGMDKVTAVAADPRGGLYVAGTADGEATLGKTKLDTKGTKLFLARLDAKGKCGWALEMPFTGTASGYLLEVTAAGDLLLGGTFSDTLTIGADKLACKGLGDAFVARFTADGKPLNAKQVGDRGKEVVTALCAAPDGGAYLGLRYEKDLTVDSLKLVADTKTPKGNAALLRLDGTLAGRTYKRFVGDNYAEVTGICADTCGNTILAGTFGPVLRYDTLEVRSRGLNDLFVAKARGADSIIWLKTYGSKYQDAAGGLSLNLLGGAMVAGSFADTLSLGTFSLAAKGTTTNTFLAQFDGDGNPTWAVASGGDGNSTGRGTAVDAGGSIYLAGTFRGKTVVASEAMESKGGEDVFLAKFHNCPPVRGAIDAPAYLCQGTVAGISVASGFYGIKWNGRAGGRTLEVSAPGTYRVEMADAKGCAVKDSVEIKYAPPVAFTLGRDTALSIGKSLRLEGPGNVLAYLWQDGTAGTSLTAQSPDGLPGTVAYTLEVTDSLGCTGSDTISVEYYLPPGFADLSGGARLVDTYPSPVVDRLSWRLRTESEVQLRVEVADAAGNVAYAETVPRYRPGEVRKVPFNGLRPGHYYLTLYSGAQKATVGLVKR
ncbi:MAG: hypothetical protein QM786_13045 [Breznakibacter sp.]